MKEILRYDLMLRGVLIAAAAVATTAFPAALAGYSTLHDLALSTIVPAAVVLVIAWAFLRRSNFKEFC